MQRNEFEFESAREFFINLNLNLFFSKSMNLNVNFIFSKSMNLNFIFSKPINLNLNLKNNKWIQLYCREKKNWVVYAQSFKGEGFNYLYGLTFNLRLACGPQKIGKTE